MTNIVSFGDHVDIILGGTPNTSKEKFWNGEIPWASVVDFPDSKRINTTQKTITQLGLEKSNTKLLNSGDIILSARGTVGKLVVCGRPMAFNQSCYALRTKDNTILDQDFLFYMTNTIVHQFQKLAVGGVFDTIIKSTIEKIHFTLKPISTQRKIASTLSAYDDLIENNLKRIKLLEESARLIYEEWFVRFTINDLRLTIDNETGMPEGWGKFVLKELVEYTVGGGWGKEVPDENYKEKAYVIRGTDIPEISKGNFSILPLRYHTESNLKSRLLQDKDIVFEISNGQINNLGRSFLYSERIGQALKEKVICASFCRLLRFNEKKFASIVYQHLNYIQNNDSMRIYKSPSAAGINNFRFKAMLEDERIVLPIDEKYSFLYNLFSSIEDKIDNLILQINLLKEARDILLPRLMNGTIEVDKPQSPLLWE
jgi:type I restriction enzyme, S subunit